MMTRPARRFSRTMTIALGLAAASLVAAGCGSSGSSNGSTPAGTSGQTVPTANLPVLQKIGKGEGQLNLIAWEGYLNPVWFSNGFTQIGLR